MLALTVEVVMQIMEMIISIMMLMMIEVLMMMKHCSIDDIS